MNPERCDAVFFKTMILAALAGLFFACGNDNNGVDSGGPVGDGRISVFVTISPQAYFVEKIAAGRVDVSVLVPPGRDPHMFEIASREISRLSESRVFLGMGLPLEKVVVAKIEDGMPNLVYVDTSEGIRRRPLDDGASAGIVLSDDQADPHVWLSPRLVKLQAEKIRDALVKVDPAGKSQYEKGFADFMVIIDELDGYIRTLLSGVKQKTILAYHPAFGYFTDEYGLTQLSVEVEGKEPGARSISRTIQVAREMGIRTLFVEPQFPRREASMLAESIGAKIVEVDPLAREWAQNLMAFSRHIKESY